MFRRVLVADAHGFVHVPDQDGDGVGDGAPDDVNAGQGHGLPVHLVLDGPELLLVEVDRDEDHLAVDAVLGLRQEVRGYEGRVRVPVCDHEHLRRAGRHVDAHAGVGVVAHIHLARGHELVSGAEDLVHLAHALGTVRHGGDSLRATSKDYALSADLVSDVDNFRSYATVGSRRRSEDDLLAASYHGGNTQHERRTGKDSRATRDVQSHAFDRSRKPAADDAGHRLNL